MEMRFCRLCGERLEKVNRHTYTCSEGHTIYANSAPAVGVLFVDGSGNIILARRGAEPRKGMLDSVGGFLDGEETAEAGIVREIREETGLSPDDYEQMQFLCTAIGHYPSREETISVLSIFYWARLKPEARLKASDDVSEIVTLQLHKVPLVDVHDDDVRSAIRKLQGILAR